MCYYNFRDHLSPFASLVEITWRMAGSRAGGSATGSKATSSCRGGAGRVRSRLEPFLAFAEKVLARLTHPFLLIDNTYALPGLPAVRRRVVT